MGAVAYTQRDTIAMALISRAADGAMARNIMADLPADQLHVGFCGTGSPLPSRDRAAACTVIIANGKLFVFDMGIIAPAVRTASPSVDGQCAVKGPDLRGFQPRHQPVARGGRVDHRVDL